MERSPALPWVLPASLATAAAITTLWLTRPSWIRISENPHYVLSGVDSTPAIVGTVPLIAVLWVLTVVARRPASRGRTVVLIALCAGIVVVFLGVYLALGLGAFPDPIPR